MNLVDAHVHFWDRDRLPYPWLDGVPAISHCHTPETLRAEAGPDFPTKIVFVECGAPWLQEITWIEELAAKEPRIGGIVAKSAINAGRQTLSDIAELKKHPLVRGVRHPFESERDPQYCTRPEFIAGAKALGVAGLSFDICCKHHQLPAVTELVRQCPQTGFILDHAGKPAIRENLLDPWRANMRELARLPNIVCKLSGLVTEADHRTWTAAQLQPYVTHLLETFGPNRLLFGGDWPVVKLATDYQRWLGLAREFTAHLTTAEQSAIFHDNAVHTYRL